MAALPDSRSTPEQHIREELVELRTIDADRLTPLLDEEIAAWRAELDWDFRASADLVRRFIHMQALGGYALVSKTANGPRVVGYSYYVCEEGKGLIGDLYVMRERPAHVQDQQIQPGQIHSTQTPGSRLEHALIEAVLGAIWRMPGVKRVEAQPMMLGSPLDCATLGSVPSSRPGHGRPQSYPRKFLATTLGSCAKLAARPPSGAIITGWTESMQDHTARLISAAYQGHIDSRINDQYRSPSGARRFLTNIVQYPGCGTFFKPASFAAIDIATRQLRGISLASLVASDCGHITQICVAKAEQGTGLGYELMRQSMIALKAHGCRAVSLTVTASNEAAIRLYQRLGFSSRRDFAAYVWDPRES
jgi:ribosomal protein S18 acetylase RimI-like enzyme